jgi:hypothetical protein
MPAVTAAFLTEQLELADRLRAGRAQLLDPQDLPGRYGRVVQAIDHVLQAAQSEAVLGGGWAVWRHGYVGRVTQDIDVALPQNRVEEFLRVAVVAGFQTLSQPEGHWPKLVHRETGIEVDILPEGGRPGTSTRPAPTTIRSPRSMGASGWALRYMDLPSLIELKLAAGRARDDSDVVELLRANPNQVETVRAHLCSIHPDYSRSFDLLAQRAREQQDQ